MFEKTPLIFDEVVNGLTKDQSIFSQFRDFQEFKKKRRDQLSSTRLGDTSALPSPIRIFSDRSRTPVPTLPTFGKQDSPPNTNNIPSRWTPHSSRNRHTLSRLELLKL